MVENKPVNIIYISEVALVRKAVPVLFSKYSIRAPIIAKTYGEIKSKIPASKPFVLLLDFYNLPDNINTLIRQIKDENPKIKILILGLYNSLEVASELLKNGAQGYYDQHCPGGTERLASVIHILNEGGTVLIPSPYSQSKIFRIEDYLS